MLIIVQEEAVRENLKNVLLFMESNGALVPPTEDATKKEMWEETWKRVDRFLPDLRAEIAPAAEEPEPKPTAGADGAAKSAVVDASQEAKSAEERVAGQEVAEAGAEEGQAAEKTQAEEAAKEEQDVD